MSGDMVALVKGLTKSLRPIAYRHTEKLKDELLMMKVKAKLAAVYPPWWASGSRAPFHYGK
jgi:hypothetical protein